MRKIIVCFCALIIALTFSGCTLSKSFTSLAHEYLISALGFDKLGKEISVFLEAVIVNSEDSNAEKRIELLSGSGKTLEEAMLKAMEKSAQPIELSHCAVAVIGETVDKKYFKEICQYLYNEKELTLSMILVSTENAEALLSSDTVASVAVGYDIMSMQEAYSKLSGIDFENRFYEIEAKRFNKFNTFSLPFLKSELGGYYIDGITVFKDDCPEMHIENSEASVFAIATDSQTSGLITLGDKRYNIESVYTVCGLKNKNLPQINLEIELKADNKKELKNLLKTEVKKLFSLSQEQNLDIFGIGNIIDHKESDFFKKIRKNYDKFYENLVLEVTIK